MVSLTPGAASDTTNSYHAAGIPFQPDLFAGYTPHMMQNEGLSMFSGAQDTPALHRGSAEWLLLEPEGTDIEDSRASSTF